MSQQRLAGLRLLILEDEFLIAMDVEQLCRDHGAEDVSICKTIDEAASIGFVFDAAVIDVMLDGQSTLGFARKLRDEAIPFIFASGYTDRGDIKLEFPAAAVVGKPYSGNDLIEALVGAITSRQRG